MFPLCESDYSLICYISVFFCILILYLDIGYFIDDSVRVGTFDDIQTRMLIDDAYYRIRSHVRIIESKSLHEIHESVLVWYSVGDIRSERILDRRDDSDSHLLISPVILDARSVGSLHSFDGQCRSRILRYLVRLSSIHSLDPFDRVSRIRSSDEIFE